MLESLRSEVVALEAALGHHPLYGAVRTRESLACFMEHHVVCVLDFMSLLKSLQRELTCVQVPWVPTPHPALARLIQEIVLGEETDERAPGVFVSHFEWYLDAMREVGARTEPIREVVAAFAAGVPPMRALSESALPAASITFSRHTFGLLDAPLATRAAVFFHGRESVIPQMFLPLAEELERSGTRCDALLGYLHRHVEVDGDAHGPAAQRLLHELYVSDSVELSALRAAKSALEARRALWDATLAALPRAHTTLRA
ncbi:MAG: DUF3050 domain-containing protein [Sandaracinus sp.]|nr:DUF3050 domain-containing protein [Myxococcales bacterium]MCB9621252.1 DUF3050 domain-containing protein [Sandaracinus sp.]MCB9622200.1 DUF3050 domain-containing protein [Sandaracinus sp.]MCB9636424.1 DUF3050 domain-containing protein [Sandaracinus sp.]